MNDEFRLWLKNTDREITLKQEKVLIGRFFSCDILLNNSNVSRIHAEITRHDGGWFIRDLESRNGTWLNGNRLIPWEEYLLKDNDYISLCHNREVMCFNMISPDEDEKAVERVFLKVLNSFTGAELPNDVAFDLIIHMLVKTPVYILLADRTEDGTLSAEEIDTFQHDELLKKAVFTFDRINMLPVFTTPEKAGVDGVFMRMTPNDWIDLAVKSGKSIIINPYQKERFVIPHLFLLIGIYPFTKGL